MSDVLRLLSDFSDITELGFTAQLQTTGVEISRGGEVVCIAKNPFAEFVRDPTKYIVLPCFTGNVGERQVTALRMKGPNRGTLGYIFPLEALRTGDFIEDDWERRYAWVGVNSLLSAGTVTEHVAASPSSNILAEGSISLDQLFLSHTSVAVLGRQNLEQHSVTEADVPLMLMACGVRFPVSFAAFSARVPLREWSASLSLQPISAEAASDLVVLETLIRLADEFDAPVGVFLTLYQIIEHWSGKSFSNALAGTFLDSPTPWKLKKRLNKISGDRWRLAKIDELSLGDADRTSLNDLGGQCRIFLTAIGEQVKDGDAWWRSLYAVRNIIVHDQARFVQAGFYNLADVNQRLRDSCLELLSCYKSPGPEEYWTSESDSDEPE